MDDELKKKPSPDEMMMSAPEVESEVEDSPEDDAPMNQQFNDPMSAAGQPTLEHTKEGFDIRAEPEEDEAAKPPPNDGPEDSSADGEKPKDGKKPPPFEKKPDGAKPEDKKPEDKKPTKSEDLADTVVASGMALKSLGDGRIGGYLVAWGNALDTDLTGEYFTRETDFAFEKGYRVEGEPVMFHHGLDKTLGPRRLGRIENVKMDEIGIWGETVLDMADAYQKKIDELCRMGKLNWSSGALPQAVRVERDGWIKSWPIIEASLTPTPAQPLKTRITPVKALPEVEDLFSAAGQTDTQTPIDRKTPDPTGAKLMDIRAERMVDAVLSALTSAAGITLSPDEGKVARESAIKAIEAMGDMDQAKVAEHIKSAEFIDTVEKIVRDTIAQDDVVAAVKARVAAKSQPQPQGAGFRQDTPRIQMRTKYADLDAREMAFYAFVRSNMKNAAITDPYFMPEMVDKAQKMYGEGKLKMEDNSIKALTGMKANELEHTTNTGYGAEWVADLWSSDLWERARFQNLVASRIRSMELPSATYTLPLESTDPTVYRVAETTAETQLTLNDANSPIPDSKMATRNTTISTVKMGVRIGISMEMTEDSIIPFIPQTRNQMMKALQDQLDFNVLNGDTSIGTANISYKGGTTTSAMALTVMDGIRKHGLLGAAANRKDVNGTLSLAALRAGRFQLPPPLATNLSNLVMFVDVQTYGQMLNLPELNQWWMNGRDATVNTGNVLAIDSIPVIPTDQLGLAEAGGYVNTTAASNTKGQILLVPLDQWIMGYRRRVTASLDFYPAYDSYQMVATMRVGMINREGYAGTGNVVHYYNITVS